MIDDRGALEPLGLLREGGGVGDIGVAAGNEGLVGGFRGGNDAAIGPQDVFSALEGADLREGEAIFPDGVLVHVEGRFFFFEAETEGLDAVVQREGLHTEALGLQDGLRLLHLQGRVADLEADAVSVIAEEEFEDGAEVHGGEDVQRHLASLHAEGAQKAENAEHVVSVDMGEEKGIQFHHGDAVPYECILGSFSTIQKEQAPMHLQCLGALVPAPYGHGRCRAQ